MRISDWSSDVCSSDLFEVAPALERAVVARRHPHQLRPQMQTGEAAAIGVGLLGDVDDRLAHQHEPLDDPVERAAVEDLGAPRRHHPGIVAQTLAALQAARLPFLQLLHALHADAELRSEEHTSELQSLMRISYAVFCLKKKK